MEFSSLNPNTLFLIIIWCSVTQGYITHNTEYQYVTHHVIEPVQENHYDDYNSISENLTPEPDDLQTKFMNLFNVDEMSKMAKDCTPRFTGDLSFVRQMCPRSDFYYGMNPRHIDAVHAVTRLMQGATSGLEKVCMAAQLRNSSDVNPHVWLRSLMGTVMHNPELRNLQRPNLVEVFPMMFIPSTVMSDAKKLESLGQIDRVTMLNGKECMLVDYKFGAQNGRENDLWYFREDVMLNAHHWYWHLFNPFAPTTMPGQQPPKRIDRRGEIFHYMHLNMLARYHSEKLSNGHRGITPLNLSYSTIIRQPYYPNLDGTNSGRRWTNRLANAPVQDLTSVSIPGLPMNVSVANRTRYLNRVLESITAGRLLTPNSEAIPLNNIRGIDYLGDVLEASVYSVNPSYYGAVGVHNSGHLVVGLGEDPDGSRGLPPGVMSDPAVAMRDPQFYRYHLAIANIFEAHKSSLPAYQLTEGELPLLWDGISVDSFAVIPLSRRPNELTTYFSNTTYDLSRGLDFNRSTQGPIPVCVRHLDYEHFEYQISIKKDTNVKSAHATFRIFMAPTFDENQRPYTLAEQRHHFFAMDQFTASIVAGGNLIRRRSTDSTVTIPSRERLNELNRDANTRMPNCGCGHPQHLLLPKGNRHGMRFDLFLMVTNTEEDTVPYQEGNQETESCIPAHVLCGIPDQPYPDTKPMGYPLDRLPYSVVENDLDENPYGQTVRLVSTIQEYAAGLPNAAVVQVRITHIDDGRIE